MLALAMLQSPPVELSDTDLALVSICLLINVALSWQFKLGMQRSFLVAGLRTVVQLFAIGYVLEEVFAIASPLLVLLILSFMALMAGFTIWTRNKRKSPGNFIIALGSISLPAFLMTTYAVFVIVVPENWADPRYLIPLMGMMLGNSLTAVNLAMDSYLNAMVERRAEVETWLCLGADIREATHGFSKEAMRLGMTPMLNAMMVVGLVSLPGMMTGQILGGTNPVLAVRYQILIMFLLAGSTAMGAGLCVLWLRRRLFDEKGRLRPGIELRRGADA